MKDVKAKKHLGQHFLNNSSIAYEITDLINNKAKNVVEIGPGMGVLTKFLLEKNYSMHVVEIDRESVFYLRLNYPKLSIYEGDFLNLNLKEMYHFNFSLIGNFPYNISSQILFKAFENRDQIDEIVGMFQKEVAERIACVKGKKRGILSVFIQAFYDVEYCFTVNEDVFIPQPKVKSGVIRLVRNSRDKLTVDEIKFKRIVKASFNQRRKILRNALKPYKIFLTEEIKYLLNLRAEQLSVDDFIKLTEHVN